MRVRVWVCESRVTTRGCEGMGVKVWAHVSVVKMV